jgi:hypothetical protein
MCVVRVKGVNMKLLNLYTVIFDGSENLQAAINLLLDGVIFGGDLLDALTGDQEIRKSFEAEVKTLADEAYDEEGGYESGYEASQEVWAKAWYDLESSLLPQLLRKTLREEYLS